MRTKLLAAALTTLLAVGGSAVAFAQAGDAIYAHRQEMATTNQPSAYSGARGNHAFADATQHNDHNANVNNTNVNHEGNVASTAQTTHHQPQG